MLQFTDSRFGSLRSARAVLAATAADLRAGRTPLRIGFDMDGVLADLSSAVHGVERRLAESGQDPDEGFEAEDVMSATDGEAAPDVAIPLSEEDARAGRRRSRRRRERLWRAIKDTPDFWRSLQPLDQGAVARIHQMMLRHGWEVFFITQRPRTAGDTVQRQTQRWLVEQGFDLPTVVVLAGSRGGAAGALALNYHVDDNAQNCLDVLAESGARPLLVVADDAEATVASARKLGIGTARSVAACLDVLERATSARARPELLADIASMVGWK